MAGKKVIDADQFRNCLIQMKNKQYAMVPYNSSTYYGNAELDSAIRNMTSAMSMEIARTVNMAFQEFVDEMIRTTYNAERDEMESMCGLCRPRDGEEPIQF